MVVMRRFRLARRRGLGRIGGDSVGPQDAPTMDLASEIAAADACGMLTALWARLKPDAPAVYDRSGGRSFAEVNARANRIVRYLRGQGVPAGAHVGLLSGNRAEAMEVLAATLRGGYRLVPINWRLTTPEIAYLIEDSDATALFADAQFEAGLAAARAAERLDVRVAIGGEAAGFVRYEAALDGLSGEDISDPRLGHVMFYTSGTTGRPKGVYKPKLSSLGTGEFYAYDAASDVQLCVCPIHHGSGLTLDTRSPMSAGVPVVYLDRWNSEEVLRTIAERKVTHGHMAPIMFQRLLALPPQVRARYDLSSLKRLLHGAAPCPPAVKRAMIDWLGPVLHEYYSGTEGGGNFTISSQEWLRRPGSVGRRPAAAEVKILGEDGALCPPGVPGQIYFRRSDDNPFVYYKDETKTDGAYRGQYFTLGDVGYFDHEEYLFLTGRTAECIIAGGVNIYPQEIDNEILKHPAVEDCATVGAPNPEWGEEVKAVVKLRPGYAASAALADEIAGSLRSSLAAYKIPRSVDFVAELPRNAAGKVERRKVRATYWAGRDSEI
jgi:long-chain acyl-CoA synthetase